MGDLMYNISVYGILRIPTPYLGVYTVKSMTRNAILSNRNMHGHLRGEKIHDKEKSNIYPKYEDNVFWILF